MQQTPLEKAIADFENKIGGKFKPDNRFYEKVGINRRRFAQLIRGEKHLFGYEIKALAEHFQINATELFYSL